MLKRRQNLTPQQKFHLRDLLGYNLQTVQAYLLTEVPSNNAQKNTKNLDKGVHKMFAHFPTEKKR